MDEAVKFRKGFLLLLVIGISLLFFFMVKGLLLPVFMAAIFTGLIQSVHAKIFRAVGQKPNAAALVTLLLVLLGIVIPLTIFAGIVANEAVNITETVAPILQERVSGPDPLGRLTTRFPVLRFLDPYQDALIAKVGQMTATAGGFLLNSLATATLGTVHFFFKMFVMLYAMFFFLRDGPKILDRILYLMPLSPQSEDQLVRRFTSVTRATVKGTLIIGGIQGGLAGLAFWLAGINGSAFWGTMMAVLSIIPGVGTALIWVPGVIYLFAIGQNTAAVLVTIWCAAIVGTADNFLRPRLVGRDTEMSDLMILLSTLGGLVMFGAAGIVVGPIVAALFVTVWAIYAQAFKDILPSTGHGPLATETADL